MQKITPFLWFNNNAEEAMELYTSVFDDAKVITTQRYPEGGPMPAGTLMVASVSLFGLTFNLMNAGPTFKFNESVSFVVNCKSQEEVDKYWKALTANGGEESMCGWLKDKFGLSWQITPSILPQLMGDKDPKKAAAVMQAMMKMKKIIVADIEAAYENA